MTRNLKPSHDLDNSLASILQAASLGAARQKAAKQCYRCSTEQPKQCYRAYLGRQRTHRSKMHISAVTIAEFLIMVVIIMSLPKLVTS